MNSQKKVFLLAAALMFFSLGCETCRGTASGFKTGIKKDWEKVQEMDLWVNDTMW